MTREYTRKLLEMVDEGVLDAKDIMLMAVNALSEDDVADMCRANDLLGVMGLEEDDEDEELDFDDDGQPNEAQEWNDYDPDC